MVRRRSRGEIVLALLVTALFAAIGFGCFWLGSYMGGGPHWLYGLIGVGVGGLFGHMLFVVGYERG